MVAMTDEASQLLENGSINYIINSNMVNLEKIQILAGDDKVSIFSISVNGIDLEQRLIYLSSGSPAKFIFQILELDEFVADDNPYNALSSVIGKPAFSAYLESLKTERAQREARREQLVKRILDEAQRFRAVLVRKYRQLTYIDEYETVENRAFLEEAKRFAAKRLPNEQAAVDLIVLLLSELVPAWVAQEDAQLDAAKFDASMSPTDYERFCADRFAAAGWKVRLTKGSGDQGADIICEATGRRLVVQCKLYSGSVGNAAVQEVIAAREFEYANSAAVVSNAPFTMAARELASTARVHLLHHDEIGNITPEP